MAALPCSCIHRNRRFGPVGCALLILLQSYFASYTHLWCSVVSSGLWSVVHLFPLVIHRLSVKSTGVAHVSCREEGPCGERCPPSLPPGPGVAPRMAQWVPLAGTAERDTTCTRRPIGVGDLPAPGVLAAVQEDAWACAFYLGCQDTLFNQSGL